MKNTERQWCRPARGMTLVELLVVISIIVILASVTTAMVQPLVADREIREAARVFNTYVAGSIARAAETGRPAGIWIQRSANGAGQEVFTAEVPPIYGGDGIDSKATAINVSGNAGTASLTQATMLPSLVDAGDYIRFNFQGPRYRISQKPTGANVNFVIANNEVGPPPYPSTAQVPFQIYRQPRRSSVQPLQMPGAMCVDLSASGTGDSGVEFGNGSNPVIITFTPTGSVDLVYANWPPSGPWEGRRVVKNIHFLIGRVDKLGADNLADMNNRWVSVGYQSGTATTTENMGGTIANARQFAISGKGMGGR